MNGGEDYELLFTVKQEDYEKVKNMNDINIIGYMTNDVTESSMMMKSGTMVKITAPGYEHF